MNALFHRMSGAGNTFWISDSSQFKTTPDKNLIKKLTGALCNGNVATDGLAVLMPDNDVDFSWIFLNRDGSDAEMCGNAARCVSLYARKFKLVNKDQFKFRTIAGVIDAQIDNADSEPAQITVGLTVPEDILFDQTMDHATGKLGYHFVNSGVPHAVIQVDALDPLEQHAQLCSSLREPGLFPPGGANITLIELVDTGVIKSASFERGVEDFTPACGTGAVAAAIASQHLQSGSTNKYTVHVPGGTLQVGLDNNQPSLTGPAIFTHEQEVDIDNL